MKDKTLDELKDMPVTEELKREVSKRVWEAQGNCWHEDMEIVDADYAYGNHQYFWSCPKCGENNIAGRPYSATPPENPDYTRPENFWPMMEEIMNKHNGVVRFDEDKQKYWISLGFMWTNDVLHENIGLAVEFAYLKIEEQANDTTADT